MTGCVFCAKIEIGDYEWGRAYVVGFTPLNPVTPGHFLFVPRRHVTDAIDEPLITAETMRAAVEYVKFEVCVPVESMNFITSVGEAATQSIRHLHIHLVPRVPGDGLHLPWTGQVTS